MPIRNGQVVGWKYTIRIRDLYRDLDVDDLPQDVVDAKAKEIGKELYKRLSGYSFIKTDYWDLEDFLDVENQDHLNDLLDSLYDYCDSNLIWVAL